MFRILLFILLPLLIFGQIQFIPVSCDYASFHANDSLAYLEVYVSVFQGSLKYTQDTNGNFLASFTNKLELSNQNGTIQNFAHNYSNSFQDTLTAHRYNQFIDVFPVAIPYGSYKAKVQIHDNTSQKNGEYLFEINTISPVDDIFISDIELCSSIIFDTTQSIYHKNGLRVIPNPRRIYDFMQPMLYFYIELNNLSFEQDHQNKYNFNYNITTNEGDTVKTGKTRVKSIAGPKIVEFDGFNAMALPNNIYFLNVYVKDLATDKESRGRVRFQVYKPTSKKTPDEKDQNEIITGIYGEFTKDDLVKEFSMARYVATRDEEKVFEKLENADAMKAFLATFWQSKDRLYHKSQGEFRKIYMNRVEIANQRFQSMGREGWKTDRGRVLLIYGEPDEYERFPSSMDALPYIIWHYYNLEGSQIFVFTDMDGFGDYRQIHSSYRRELQNPNWQTMITKSNSGSNY